LLLAGGIAATNGVATAAVVFWGGWALMASDFCLRRLTGATRRISHVLEMIVTSIMIPPYPVFWRLYGAWKNRVAFF